MIHYHRPAQITAFEAISAAQKLAFSPIAFQASLALVRLGVLAAIEDAGDDGADCESLARQLGLDAYGIRVLLDMASSIGLVWMRRDRYVLDKMGHFLLNDRMTRINMNFVADVCYGAMEKLQDAITRRAPAGLERFGDWPTLYPGLTQLPEPARSSWYTFDQYHSARAFPDALPIVFAARPSHILDIGGNTGLWALSCAAHDDEVRMTVLDLPAQIRSTGEHLAASPYRDRISLCAMDVLRDDRALPNADVVWMSQFLDCLPPADIVRVLSRVAAAMPTQGSLYVLELFPDRQDHEAAAYSINATSLYFTCIANGASRMYPSEQLIALIREAGFEIAADHDRLGAGHTLLHCVKAAR